MILGGLICWFARKRGGKHVYSRSEPTIGQPVACLLCGHQKRPRKAKTDPLDSQKPREAK